jgi:hypothetical protein
MQLSSDKFGAIVEDNPPGLQGTWWFAMSVPSEVTLRQPPDNLELIKATPASLDRNSLDIVSPGGIDADVLFKEATAAARLERLGFWASIYLAVGAGVIAALLFEMWRGPSQSGPETASASIPTDRRKATATPPVTNGKKLDKRRNKNRRRKRRRGRR